MTGAQRTRLKWAVTCGGLLWLLVMGWLMTITLPPDTIENHNSATVQARMDDCSGTYRDRYNCKEAIIVHSGRDTFFAVAGRFLLVILPPLLATGWLSSYLRRHALVQAEHHHAADGDWKARARMHTQMQSPEEAAHDLHMKDSDLPHIAHPHRHVADIAPAEDWKAKATNNTRRPKE